MTATDLHRLARQALTAWGAPDQVPRLVAHRENAVFEMRLADGRRAALRLHRPGYRPEAALAAETGWMAALAQGGVPVPRPLATQSGDWLLHLPSGQVATAVSWIEGPVLGISGEPLPWQGAERWQVFHRLGAALARLHEVSDRWTPPAGFSRPSWDVEGLLGEAPLWGRFWEAPQLDAETATELRALRDRLRDEVSALDGLDFGLIHADAVRENVILDQPPARGLHLIDFDDAGPGWRGFELATALLRNLSEPDAPTLARALIAGYRSERAFSEAEVAALPLFLLLRATTYVGWLGSRPDHDRDGARMARYLRDVRLIAARREAGWDPLTQPL